MNNSFLIVGLGNPGREYINTRHNIGFLLLNELAKLNNVSFSRVQFNALITDFAKGDQKIFLAKPQTYMNRSDKAVVAITRFYKINLDHLIVCNDDMDLPLGAIRIRGSGGSGGQRGIDSIIEGFGTKEIPRIRLGIGRPPGRMNPSDYVLQHFNQQEMEIVASVIERSVKAVTVFIEEGLSAAMTQFNREIL